jgi:hypothetical protein
MLSGCAPPKKYTIQELQKMKESAKPGMSSSNLKKVIGVPSEVIRDGSSERWNYLSVDGSGSIAIGIREGMVMVVLGKGSLAKE